MLDDVALRRAREVLTTVPIDCAKYLDIAAELEAEHPRVAEAIRAVVAETTRQLELLEADIDEAEGL
jgi:hypothetical protein